LLLFFSKKVVLEEDPLFVAPCFRDFNHAVDLFEKCSDAQLEQLLSLSGDGLVEKVKKNGVSLENGSGGVFLLFSRLNHTCGDANCEFELTFDHKMKVSTLRNVAKNEELLICYKFKHMNLNKIERQFIILRSFHFLCSCERCESE
jgi:hypothetical protein